MSCSYADGLSPYENKGKLGLKEIFDSAEDVKNKVKTLAGWIEEAKHVVLHTGAGISTTAGIPDFRGPKGVWTLEAKGEKPKIDISFDDASPTLTHMAILKLVHTGLVKYVVSQNIDGLHLKSGLSRDYLSELHGNMYIEECKTCNRQFVMEKATSSVGQKYLGRRCPSSGRRPCRGKTYDTILDWEAGLPEQDLDMAYYHSTVADLNICLGTTLQINPSGNLPLSGKKKQLGKLVICNLQPTKHDRKADLIINTYVDDMMTLLMGCLDLKIDPYSPEINPLKHNKLLEWTISKTHMQEIKGKYQQLLKDNKPLPAAKRKLIKTEICQEKPLKMIKQENCKKELVNDIKQEKDSDSSDHDAQNDSDKDIGDDSDVYQNHSNDRADGGNICSDVETIAQMTDGNKSNLNDCANGKKMPSDDASKDKIHMMVNDEDGIKNNYKDCANKEKILSDDESSDKAITAPNSVDVLPDDIVNTGNPTNSNETSSIDEDVIKNNSVSNINENICDDNHIINPIEKWIQVSAKVK